MSDGTCSNTLCTPPGEQADKARIKNIRRGHYSFMMEDLGEIVEEEMAVELAGMSSK